MPCKLVSYFFYFFQFVLKIKLFTIKFVNFAIKYIFLQAITIIIHYGLIR